MKHLNISILLVMLMSMVGVEASAHDFAVANNDGVTIYYVKTSDTEVAVSYGGRFWYRPSGYTGSVVIPESITYDGITYRVTSIGDYAFSASSSLISIEIPNSVTSIGNRAFSSCSGLTSIEIPNSVTSIGSYAFFNCSSLTSIEIPNSVTSIGSKAFSGCSGLTSIEIPNSVTTISGYEFLGCTGLTSVIFHCKEICLGFSGLDSLKEIVIGNEVTSIGSYAFNGCTGLTSIEIPNSVTSIGDDAFSGCTGLTSVTIGNSVTSIGSYAFNGCTGLTSIEIPNGVTSIDRETFYGCTGLTSIEIPNSVKTIGYHAFYGCIGLTSVTIGNSVTSIHGEAFSGCTGLTSVIFHCKEIGSWFSGWESIKEIVIGDEVTSIGGRAFSGCTGLTSIEIPNSVTSIDSYAFSGCTGLTSIEIPNGVTTIGREAFSGCTGLTSMTSITIPNSVTSIGDEAFSSCTGLTSIIFHCKKIGSWFSGWESIKEIVIGDEVMSIGSDAFNGCTGLTSIEIPNSVTSIGGSAFNGCTGLTSIIFHCKVIGSWFSGWESIKEIVIGDEVTSIGDRAFSGCTGLTSIEIPNSVTTIGREAFSGCTGLTSIEIPNGVTNIGDYAFSGCTGLTSMKSITIPNSVTSIGKEAFSDCTGLTSVTFHCKEIGSWFSGWESIKEIVIGNEVTSIGREAFSGCSGLKKVIVKDIASWCSIKFSSSKANPLYYAHHIYSDEDTEITDIIIPNSVSTIGDYAFYGCTGLTSIDIPNGVTSIGDCAFAECDNLQEITIPSSVTSMDGAFYECTNLIKIVSEMQIPPAISSSTFSDYTYREGTLIIPVDATFEYETSAGWKEFVYMVEEGKEEKTAYELTIANEGTLISTVEDLETSRIEHVVIKGRLNGSDIAYLRSPEGKFAHLKTLDLKDVTLVQSDDYYSYITYGTGDTSSETVIYFISDSVYTTGYYYTTLLGQGVSIVYKYNNSLDGAFHSLNLKKVIMPSSISQIGEHTFEGCNKLKEVWYGENVKAIRKKAFYGCSSLETIPSLCNIETIEESSFEDCISLIGNPLNLNNARTIGKSAFMGCVKFNSVEFSNRLNSVEAEAFSGCSALEEVEYDENTPVLFSRTSFEETPWIDKKTQTEDGIIYLGKMALGIQEETAPRELTFRNGTLCIAHDFTDSYTYEKLRTINMPNSVQRIGNRAFFTYYNSNIEFIRFSDNLEEIGSEAFRYNKRLESLYIPNSVKKVGYCAFANMEKLTTVKNYNAPMSGDGVFRYCEQLKKVYLGNNIRTLGNEMFYYCHEMSSITVYPSEVVEASDDDFYKISKSDCVVYVPKNLVDSYRAADGWKTFNTIVEIPGINPIIESEEIVFSKNLNKTTELDNIVIDNTYYNMDADSDDGYNTVEQALVLNSTTTVGQMTAVQEAEVGDAAVRENYNGIIFEVPAGKGTITVDTKTVGTHVLNVQVGKGTPTLIQKSERGTVDVLYNVTEPTYVYLYASSSDGSAVRLDRAGSIGTNSVLLYGYKVTMDVIVTPGDANGDGNVNVTDIVEIVNYILGHPSAKFNKTAADVNNDGVVNVTDIVSVVNIILSSNARELTNRAAATNNLKLNGGSIKLRNAENYTAAQFDIHLTDGSTVNYLSLNSASDHQMTWKMVDANTCRVIVYSLSNAPFRTAKDELFNVTLSGNATISNELLVNVDGMVTGINEMQFDKPVDVYDLRGNKVRSNTTDLNGLQKGVYIVNGKKVIVK